MNGTVLPNFADVPLRIYSITHSDYAVVCLFVGWQDY